MQYVLWTTHNFTKFYLTLICTGRPVTSRSILQRTRRCWTRRGERRPPTGDLMIRSTPGPEQSKSKYTSSVLYAYHFMKKCFSLFMLDIKKIFLFFTVEVMTLNTDAMISNWSREFRDLFQVGVSCTQYDRTRSSRSVQ